MMIQISTMQNKIINTKLKLIENIKIILLHTVPSLSSIISTNKPFTMYPKRLIQSLSFSRQCSSVYFPGDIFNSLNTFAAPPKTLNEIS